MRVLFLSPRKAWPPTSGARLRDYHFAKSLGSRFDLLYLFFGLASDAAEFQLHLQAERIEAIAAPRKYTASKVVRGLAGSTPLPVLNYTGPAMLRAIKASIARAPVDIIHMESLHLAGYLPAIRQWAPHALTVLNWHNIESELMLRFAENTGSRLRSLYARLTAGKLHKLENELLADCDGHLVCSEREKHLLLTRNPKARVALMENGVDTERFLPDSHSDLARLVFVGQMSYHANIEAAVWFVREIWPAIHARFPQFTLALVGSDPVPRLRELERPGEIEVTGTVPDVLPFYQHAFASVVPLQTGGGTRLKILEAMAAGTPVIATAAGAEGLEVVDGRTIQIAGPSAEAWIAALENLQRPESRHRMIQEARDLVCRRYDWASIGTRLADSYATWVRAVRSNAV